MSNHTPGPWIQWLHDDDAEYPDNIELGQRSGFRIATVWNTPRQDAEANAMLIAAAPDLLTACEAALPVLEQLPPELVNAASTRALALVRDAVHELRSE